LTYPKDNRFWNKNTWEKHIKHQWVSVINPKVRRAKRADIIKMGQKPGEFIRANKNLNEIN
jgi:hypothetical protein